MIQKAVYFSICYLLITPTLIYNSHIPNAAKWFTEVMAIAFIPVILICLAINKKFYASFHYLVLIILTFFIVGISFLYNQSSPSALILGLRHHFTYLPFFLLPLVYNFTENDIKKILWLVCFILIIQAPISFLQRFVWFFHLHSGDPVRGTLGGSGNLSVTLVSGISILYSFFLAKQIKLKTLIILSALFLFPTLINETKATFLMLPIALGVSTLLFGDKKSFLKVKKIGSFFLIIAIFGLIFIKAYDFIYVDKYEHSRLPDHLQRTLKGGGYIYYGEDETHKRIEEGYGIGRLDTIMMAIQNISKDPGNFFFGIGIGNAVPTKMSFLKTENYHILKFEPVKTTIANILWELGVSGLISYLALLLFMFKDAYMMREQNSFIGALCLGWCSVIGIHFITLFYHNVFYRSIYYITFWLLAGIVISKSYQFKMKSQNQQSFCNGEHNQHGF